MPRGIQKNHRDDKIRPTKMKIVIDAIIAGMRVREAAAAAGVDSSQVYQWKQMYPDFAAQMNVAMAGRNAIVEDSLYTQAVNGNITAAIFFLCNRAADRWKHVQNIQHTGAGGNPIQITAAAAIMAGLTDAQLTAIAAQSRAEDAGKKELPSSGDSSSG